MIARFYTLIVNKAQTKKPPQNYICGVLIFGYMCQPPIPFFHLYSTSSNTESGISGLP